MALDPSLLQQTRKDRRLYIGGLPSAVTGNDLRDFLNAALQACQGVPRGELAVLSTWLAPDSKFAFVEFVSTEVAATAMGLSGINWAGTALRLSRPANYLDGSSYMQPIEAKSAVLGAALAGAGLG